MSDLFTHGELANCEGTGAGGVRTVDDIAAFCNHRKRKVKAAIAVCRVLDAATAQRISSIEALLTRLTS
jgi:putative ATP-dependent endonuclease of OLD family